MKPLMRAVIRCSLMLLVTAPLFSVRPVQAYTVTLEQVGSNVVATGSGPINLTGLTFSDVFIAAPVINAGLGTIRTDPSGSFLDGYFGFTGPTSFGSGGFFFASTSSGDFVGITQLLGGVLFVPQGYVSGAALSDSMTFNKATFASLGVTPGTYVWTWGTGLESQNFTLVIGGAGVPDVGSTVSLLGCALLGLTALRRKLGC